MANPVAVGGSVTYTVTVTNNGPNPAAGVTLLDVLPAGVTVNSITASLGTCSGATTLTCAIGALASGQSAIVTIVVTPAAAGILTSTVTVSGNVADSDPGNNTAIYTLATLTVSAAGAGTGTVTSSVGGIDCGSTCSAAYATDALVTLTPTPAPGSTFIGWSGDCTGTGPCTVEMAQPRSVTATFNLLPVRATLISPSGSGIAATPIYTWNAVPGATWYELWVNDGTQYKKIDTWYTAAAVGCAGGGTCYVSPSIPLAPGGATWWIQWWGPSGYGSWSQGMSFTVGSPSTMATLVSPNGTISTSTPTYTWQAVPGMTWYYLWVQDTTGAKVQVWMEAATAGCGSGTAPAATPRAPPSPPAPLPGGSRSGARRGTGRGVTACRSR